MSGSSSGRTGASALRNEMLRKERESRFASSSIDAAALQIELARKMGLPVASSRKNAGSSAKKTNVLAITDSNNRKSAPKVAYKTCPSCQFDRVESNNKVCSGCGFFFLGNIVGGAKSCSSGTGGLSLAQKRGLVDVPAELKPLTAEDWSEVEQTAASRNECHCPICMVGFNQGCEVLLSCSHMFHRSCIASFEKFVKIPNEKKHQLKSFSFVCPLCRATNYQKRMTTKGSAAYRRSCAVVLQAIVRGRLARLLFRQKLRRFYNEGKGCVKNRVKFAHKEMMAVGSSITKTIESQDKTLNSLMDSSDAVLLENQNLDLLFDQMLRNRFDSAGANNSDDVVADTDEYYSKFHSASLHPVVEMERESESAVIGGLTVKAWNDLLILALNRRVEEKVTAPNPPDSDADSKYAEEEEEEEEEDECAICMGPIPKELIFPCGQAVKGGKKAISVTLSTVTMLNCSHMFHDSCITNFEKFTPFNAKSCPVCRNTKGYHRRQLSKCCVGFEHPKKTMCHTNLNKLFATNIEEVRAACQQSSAPKLVKATAHSGFSFDGDFDLAVQQSLEHHQAELEREYHQQLVELLGRGDRPASAGEAEEDPSDSVADGKELSYSSTPSFKFGGFDSAGNLTSSVPACAPLGSAAGRSVSAGSKASSASVDSMRGRPVRDKKQSGSNARSVVATGKGTGKSSAFGDLLNRYK